MIICVSARSVCCNPTHGLKSLNEKGVEYGWELKESEGQREMVADLSIIGGRVVWEQDDTSSSESGKKMGRMAAGGHQFMCLKA